MPSSKSFKFGLVNGVECVSRTGESCVFEDGNFYFYPKDSDTSCRKMTIGESFQNNGGGWGGFVGLKHEYFVYCGSKFPEIAIAKFNKKKGKWEDVGGKQFDSDETEAENSFFEGIWFTTEGPKLIFKPKKEYEKELMAEIKGKKTKKYIQVDLSTFHITGVTEKEFRNLRVHKAGANSEMPGDFYEILLKTLHAVFLYKRFCTQCGKN
ncbi:hypothetical protein HBI26_254570 [Parastagonospora nodorum]|nr:hypothetical protein HBI06_258600 [Parastagonospora nodorum]KAH4220197.1 hypothetical protein HBI05_256870 [Parastagonospora nodorum]KAH4359839.1 hypothetical protein HBH99_256350 [Parastagonospora nodorum]KAH4883884.1 hypothetical protein HBH74_243290 [Parastagonospora nodorum]KAH4892817.1 hypothetical protein HBI80_255700 [Parastagonospora nodorum]